MVQPLPLTPVPWLTVDKLSEWREKPDNTRLQRLLDSARDQILALGNHARIVHHEVADGIEERVPPGWVEAQDKMVRDIWNARRNSRDADSDAGGIPMITARFAANYRQLVRPIRGRPGIG